MHKVYKRVISLKYFFVLSLCSLCVLFCVSIFIFVLCVKDLLTYLLIMCNAFGAIQLSEQGPHFI